MHRETPLIIFFTFENKVSFSAILHLGVFILTGHSLEYKKVFGCKEILV